MSGDEELDLLSWRWEQCRCRIEGAEFRRVEGVEVMGVYDGVLFWRCTICGRSFQRWPKDDDRHAAAQPFIDACNRADEDVVRLVGPGVFISLAAGLLDLDYGGDEDAETLGEAMRRLAYEELLSAGEDDEDDSR